MWSGRYPQKIKKLHDQYGPVVRIGPNLLDLDYAELIRTIYSTDGKWRKVQQSSPFTQSVRVSLQGMALADRVL